MRLLGSSTPRDPAPTGYVGDHADKLSRVRPFAPDEESRPTREDRDCGQTLFTRPLGLLPSWLLGRRAR